MSADFGYIIAISISLTKGVPKSNVHSVQLAANWGIEGDAHAGDWSRQVSLLALESIQRMQELGAEVKPGDFAENLTIQGLDVPNLKIGDRLLCGEAELEITQIGKECHNCCAIFDRVGDCVMPREGVFARVVRGGKVEEGMKVVLIRS